MAMNGSRPIWSWWVFGCCFAIIGSAASSPRLAAAAEPAELESRHYTITSDLDRDLTIDLARRADAMFEEYSRRLSDFAPAANAPRFQIKLFQRRSDYLKLTGDRFSNTGGIFMSGQNVLAAYLEEQGRENLRRTLQHEAFHQFAFTNISPNLPIWLNEGMAQVFEEGIFSSGRFSLGEVPPRRLRQLQFDMQGRRLTDFRTLLAMTDQQWQNNLRDRATAASQYNQSWAMVHFLVFAEQDGKPRYRSRFVSWLQRMNQGQSPEAAFEEAFSGNIDGFQARFIEFARALKPTPQATLLENQNVLADLLIELRNRGKTFETVADFRAEIIRGRYTIQYTKGQIQWSTASDPALYFADLAGRQYRPEQLRFEPNPGAPLPDLVCRPGDSLPLRTRFYRLDGRVERETLVDADRAR